MMLIGLWIQNGSRHAKKVCRADHISDSMIHQVTHLNKCRMLLFSDHKRFHVSHVNNAGSSNDFNESISFSKFC